MNSGLLVTPLYLILNNPKTRLIILGSQDDSILQEDSRSLVVIGRGGATCMGRGVPPGFSLLSIFFG